MKRLIFSLICCLLFCSCDPEWVFIPPYQGVWIFQNQTNEDLTLHLNLVCLNEWDRECIEYEYYDLLKNSETEQEGESRYSEDVCFDAFFCWYFEQLVSGTVYITPKGDDKILKEWVFGADNGEHDIFDENEWSYQEWHSDDEASFTVFHREWTFTITDEDIGVME